MFKRLLCVAYIHYLTFTRQNLVQQCMHTPVFEVSHALNLQAHVCICTHVSSLIINELYHSYLMYQNLNLYHS